jgi:uncharacterized protein (UPF0333 family)
MSFKFRDSSNSSKGQVSLELLITLGVVVAFTIPVLFLLLSVSSSGQENAAKDQADATARSLAESINTVYAQGEWAKRVVLLNAPSNTEEITIKDNEVTVKIRVSEGTYEGVAPFFGNITSDFVSTESGLIKLELVNGIKNDNVLVSISEK